MQRLRTKSLEWHSLNTENRAGFHRSTASGGFTLIEVMVTMAVLLVVIPLISVIVHSAVSASITQHDAQVSQMIVDTIKTELEENLTLASEVSLSQSEGAFGVTYSVSETGRLLKDGDEVFDEAFYDNKQLEIRAQRLSAYVLEVRLTLKKGDDDLLVRTFPIRCINLSVTKTPIESDVELDFVNPTITYFL